MAGDHPELLFIAMVGGQPEIDKKTRRKIKQHVMRPFGLARRHPKVRKATASALDLVVPSDASVEGAMIKQVDTPSPDREMQFDFSNTHLSSKQLSGINLQSVLLKSTLMSNNSDILLRRIHYFTNTFNLKLDLYRDVWYRLSQIDPVANNSILAMFGAYVATQLPVIAADQTHHRTHCKIHIKSLRDVNQMLSRPETQDSDGVIVANLASVMRALIKGEIAVANVHWRGLGVLVKRRGGLNAMKTNHLLPRMIACVDTTYSYVMDNRSLKPLDHKGSISNLRHLVEQTILPDHAMTIAQQWRSRLSQDYVKIFLFEAVAALLARIKEATTPSYINSDSSRASSGRHNIDLHTCTLEILNSLQAASCASSLYQSYQRGNAPDSIESVAETMRLAMILCIGQIGKSVGALSVTKVVLLVELCRRATVWTSFPPITVSIDADLDFGLHTHLAPLFPTQISTDGWSCKQSRQDLDSESLMEVNVSVDWSGLEVLRLWCLVVGRNVAKSVGIVELLQWFEDEITVLGADFESNEWTKDVWI